MSYKVCGVCAKCGADQVEPQLWLQASAPPKWCIACDADALTKDRELFSVTDLAPSSIVSDDPFGSDTRLDDALRKAAARK